MDSKVNYTAVGVFVLLLGAALIWGILWLSSGGVYRKAYDTYLVYMDESVSGLSLDAPVRYHGVEVGRVRRIALAPDNAELVQLTLDIEHGTPVKTDTLAVLRMQGLTGIGYVELTGGHSDSPPLVGRPGEEYPVVRSGRSLMERLDSAVTSLLTNLNQSSARLNAVLDEGNRRAFTQTLSDLSLLSRALAAHTPAIDSGIANAARTLENTARVSDEMPKLVERVQHGADAFERMASEVARTSAGAAGTLAEAHAAIADARAALEDARAGARLLAGQMLPEAQALVTELRDLTQSLRRFSEQAERNPSMFLHGRPAAKRGPGE